MLGPDDGRDPVEDVVVGEDRPENLLLGLDAVGHRFLNGRLGRQWTRPEGRDLGHGTRASCSSSVF
jgi:hypothetical protein